MKIIFLSLAGIGDYVMQTPAITLLREKYKDAQIDLLTMSSAIALLAKESGKFDNIFTVKILGNTFSGLKEIIKIGKENNYDISILGFPSYRKEYHIVHFLLGAKRKLGHKYPSGGFIKEFHFLENEHILLDERKHNVENNKNILNLLGIEGKNYPCKIYLPEIEKVKKIEKGNFLKNIGIHPGGTNSPAALLRRWGYKNFSILIKKLISFNCQIFIFGGPEEVDEIEKLQFELQGCKNLVFVKKSFIESLYILKQMDILICNDNGFGHLATGLDIPVISLFGNTNPKWSAPFGDNVQVIHKAQFKPWYRYELKNSVPQGAQSGMDLISCEDILEKLGFIYN